MDMEAARIIGLVAFIGILGFSLIFAIASKVYSEDGGSEKKAKPKNERRIDWKFVILVILIIAGFIAMDIRIETREEAILANMRYWTSVLI